MKEPRNILCLGHQPIQGGEITVTNVLCFNVPPMTDKQLAELSWKLDEFFRNAGFQAESHIEIKY